MFQDDKSVGGNPNGVACWQEKAERYVVSVIEKCLKIDWSILIPCVSFCRWGRKQLFGICSLQLFRTHWEKKKKRFLMHAAMVAWLLWLPDISKQSSLMLITWDAHTVHIRRASSHLAHEGAHKPDYLSNSRPWRHQTCLLGNFLTTTTTKLLASGLLIQLLLL